jgi:hypothetical protein
MTYTVNSLPTWLDIVQRARQEMGASGVGPATVINQTGEYKRIVDWVASAYEEICKEQNWGWLYTTITATLNTGGREYNPRTDWTTPSGAPVWVGSWDLNSFKLNSVSAGTPDQQFLTFWPWDKFSATYNIRLPQTVRPYVFTIRPNGHIMFQTVMDVPYTLTADVFLAKDVPATDAAVPLIADEYRMLIVWEAVKKYAGYESDGALAAFAMAEARKLRTEMEDAWLSAEEAPAPLV